MGVSAGDHGGSEPAHEIIPLLGRTSSVSVQIGWGVTPLGALLAGFLLQELSPSAAMAVVASGMAVTAATATAVAPVRQAGRPQLSSAANAARSSS